MRPLDLGHLAQGRVDCPGIRRRDERCRDRPAAFAPRGAQGETAVVIDPRYRALLAAARRLCATDTTGMTPLDIADLVVGAKVGLRGGKNM